MLFEFDTENEVKAKAAFLIYIIYRSRNIDRGPKGVDMWAKIERFARSAAKRAETIDEFVQVFKRKMGCDTINPKYTKTTSNKQAAIVNDNGEIWVKSGLRDFGIDIFNSDDETQKGIINCLYEKTQIIILLVRDRLERERNFEEVYNDDD